MADPDLMECVPISEGSNPRVSFPIDAAAPRRAFVMSSPVIA